MASASAWEELRYLLRSLDKFFNEDYEVWIVGNLPDWIQNVKHIPHQKVVITNSGATYDAVSKLKLYIDSIESPDQFLRMYDDVYLTGARTVKQMQITRYLFTNEELISGEFVSGGIVWRDQVFRSTDAVISLGYPGYMTETHCPEVFEKDKMQEIFKIFDPLQFDIVDRLQKVSQHFLDKSKLHLGDETIQTLLIEGDSAESILKAAKDLHADIIVMGSHSRKWLENIVMGSVTEKVLHRTITPLFIIPTKKRN